ncbi:NYN domain-containing protein [Aquirufa sp. ROCK2-A2]
MEHKKNRVIAYIDAANLYFGMIDAGYTYCKWLDVQKLIQSYLTSKQELVDVKFFTSLITHNPPKQNRQNTYLEALEARGVLMYYGVYQAKFMDCRKCGNNWIVPNEKMTDVNMATQILADAFQDNYDVAIVITGDSDLVPSIQFVNDTFVEKSVVVFFPPQRHNDSIEDAARSSLIITRKKLMDAQLPKEIRKKDGYVSTKPEGW